MPRGLQVYKGFFAEKKNPILVVICTHGVTVLKSGGSFGVKAGQSAMLMGSFLSPPRQYIARKKDTKKERNVFVRTT